MKLRKLKYRSNTGFPPGIGISWLVLALLFCGFAPACMPPVEEEEAPVPQEIVVPENEVLVENGAWCWFSDPRAVYHKGEKEQMYFGTINDRGDVLIHSKNITSGKIFSFILHDSLEVDDHDVPSILILPSGHLLAFYNQHNGHVYMRRSTNAEDISDWGEERIICRAADNYRYTYTNPVRLSAENGRIYLIGRKVGPTRSFENWWQYFKHSDDDGETWSEDIILLDNQGRENPPYLKVATDHRSRIDFLFTNGHPKIGADVSVYHLYYEGDNFYQTDGTRIAGRDDLPIAIPSVNKVYDAVESQIRAWIWDIALQEGQPVITYARFPSEDDHIYYFARWKNAKWNHHKIVNSGSWMASLRQGDQVREAHYSGGIVLDHRDPTHIYLSREVNGKFELEHRKLLADGLWSSATVTQNSPLNNVRPYIVYNSPPEHAILLWMNGIYRHYTEYDMDIKVKLIPY